MPYKQKTLELVNKEVAAENCRLTKNRKKDQEPTYILYEPLDEPTFNDLNAQMLNEQDHSERTKESKLALERICLEHIYDHIYYKYAQLTEQEQNLTTLMDQEPDGNHK